MSGDDNDAESVESRATDYQTGDSGVNEEEKEKMSNWTCSKCSKPWLLEKGAKRIDYVGLTEFVCTECDEKAAAKADGRGEEDPAANDEPAESDKDAPEVPQIRRTLSARSGKSERSAKSPISPATARSFWEEEEVSDFADDEKEK